MLILSSRVPDPQKFRFFFIMNYIIFVYFEGVDSKSKGVRPSAFWILFYNELDNICIH